MHEVQGTDEWFAARLGKVTASRVSDVMMAKTTAGYQNYQAQLICERLTGQPVETFKSQAMEHGSETEDQARAYYSLTTGNAVQEVGFVPHATLQMAGASPDGLISDIGVLEIKCPQPAKHIKNLMGGTIDKAYRLQMQWQMVCAGVGWCDFVSFNPDFPSELQMVVRRIDGDPEEMEALTAAVTQFLAEVDEKERALRAMSAETRTSNGQAPEDRAA